ncbi:MAG TPA: PucR family transcriptional regulator ligand-binding domain-containing protein [Candidatus Jeotgalibaca pullicola]|nr:PucR family transcriptional regulator ligand-binding domain-containing protein [Candidatus Jeotgalibaca pullicola]
MATIESILEYRSFQHASLVTGYEKLSNEVNGIMVMEAPDIELWGRKGLLILSSYYALQDLSDREIDLFFGLAKKIGIAGFVIKIDRLISNIPPKIVSYCQLYQIPLIEIDKRTSYGQILTEISNKIINRDAYILQSYYDTHKKFLQLMMQQPGIPVILEVLQDTIDKPITLLEKVKNKIITTNEALVTYKVIKKQPLPFKKEMNFSYNKYTVEYAQYSPHKSYTQFVISIPNLGYEEYELIIHEMEESIDDIDFMIIENAIAAIQIELLKDEAIRQNNRIRLNEMASDLLHGRLNSDEAVMETILQLQLNPELNYRVILFAFEPKKENISQRLMNRFTDAIIYHARPVFPDCTSVTRKQKVFLIVPAENLSLDKTKEITNRLLKRILEKDVYRVFDLYISISDYFKLQDLPKGYQQAFDTQKILQLMGKRNQIVTYQEMGIYQLFVETDNLHSLKRFVPEVIWQLQEENPELLDTLSIFLNVNQSFSEAAQKLSIHPKTVRYRVDRLRDVYQINLNNSEEVLQYSIGIRLLKLLPQRKNQTLY